MSNQIGGGTVLFSDNFSKDGKINSSKWDFNEFDKHGSFYGRTQQRQVLPSASKGVMHLKLDTWNPPPPGHVGPWPNGPAAFYGSEAITKQPFSVGSGIAFEARVRYAQPQAGIMGGFFTFAGPPDSHDEIDFELVSTLQKNIQTNIYHNVPLGRGNPKFSDLTNPLTAWHTYRIEWLPTEVIWRVDGKVVRRTDIKTEVPTKPMFMHFNIWGQNAGDPPYSDPSLNPATTPGANRIFGMDVDSVKVETLKTTQGTRGSENLAGTASNDWMEGNGGADLLRGGAGDDTITSSKAGDDLRGGSGDDSLYSRAGDDKLTGGGGNDSLFGGAGNDELTGGRGRDRLDGGEGADVFRFESAADSSGLSYDDIHNVDFSVDRFELPTVAGPIQAVDPLLTTGTLDRGDAFDTTLTAAMAQLAAHHAALFEASAGSLAGHTFLVVDVNGVAGYQSGSDLVMRITGSTGTLTTANFT